MRCFALCGSVVFLALALFSCAEKAEATVVIDPLAWGLHQGDTFRLVVVTNGGTQATSTSIADYDTFVNTQGLNGILYNGSSLSWQAIGLTPTSNPLSDSSRYSSTANSLPIYNLNGSQVSNTTNGSRFWKTSGYSQHNAAINYTINGSGALAQVGGSSRVWTGFDYDATQPSARNYDDSGSQVGTVYSALGSSATYQGWDDMTMQSIPGLTLYPSYGLAGALANGWAYIGDDASMTTSYPMYAMSQTITVTAVPEVSSLVAMLVCVLLGTCCRGLVRARGAEVGGSPLVAPL